MDTRKSRRTYAGGRRTVSQTAVWGLVLALVFGFALAACDDGSKDSGGGGGTVTKPAILGNDATYAQADAKLDEIIAYCEKKPGTENDAIKVSAQEIKPNLAKLSPFWADEGLAYITLINTTYIGQLK